MAPLRAPFPLPAHQTGRAVFPHPAFRQVSLQGTRRRHLAHAVQHEHARVSVDLTGKPSDATAGRIVSSTQKGEHAVEDVSINSLMSRSKRAIGRQTTFPAHSTPRWTGASLFNDK